MNVPRCDVDVNVQRPSSKVSRENKRESEREIECQSRSEEESHKRNEASFVLLFLGLVSFVARGTRELAV